MVVGIFYCVPLMRYRKLKDTTALKDTTTARIFYTAVLGVASHRRRVVVSTISSCTPALQRLSAIVAVSLRLFVPRSRRSDRESPESLVSVRESALSCQAANSKPARPRAGRGRRARRHINRRVHHSTAPRSPSLSIQSPTHPSVKASRHASLRCHSRPIPPLRRGRIRRD